MNILIEFLLTMLVVVFPILCFVVTPFILMNGSWWASIISTFGIFFWFYFEVPQKVDKWAQNKVKSK